MCSFAQSFARSWWKFSPGGPQEQTPPHPQTPTSCTVLLRDTQQWGTDAFQHGGPSTVSSSWRAVSLITMTPCCSVVLAEQCRNKQTEQTWLDMFCWEGDLQGSSCFFGLGWVGGGVVGLSLIIDHRKVVLHDNIGHYSYVWTFLNFHRIWWICKALHYYWTHTLLKVFTQWKVNAFKLSRESGASSEKSRMNAEMFTSHQDQDLINTCIWYLKLAMIA